MYVTALMIRPVNGDVTVKAKQYDPPISPVSNSSTLKRSCMTKSIAGIRPSGRLTAMVNIKCQKNTYLTKTELVCISILSKLRM